MSACPDKIYGTALADLLHPLIDYRAGHIGFLDTEHKVEEFPYRERIEVALAWLGDRYLCFKPINKPYNLYNRKT